MVALQNKNTEYGKFQQTSLKVDQMLEGNHTMGHQRQTSTQKFEF